MEKKGFIMILIIIGFLIFTQVWQFSMIKQSRDILVDMNDARADTFLEIMPQGVDEWGRMIKGYRKAVDLVTKGARL